MYPLHYQVAVGEVGEREILGEADNPRILAYHQATSLRATDDETPWCASFVNWCLQVSGARGTNSAAARSFLTWGKSVQLNEAQLGDVLVFSRGSKSWQGHVAFYAGRAGSAIKVLGGNQGNAVSIVHYDSSRLLSVRREA